MNKPATTVKRSPDFSETHEYIVTLASGGTARIFRDTEQFGHAVWHLVDNGDDTRPAGIGYTKAEAVDFIERHPEVAAPAPRSAPAPEAPPAPVDNYGARPWLRIANEKRRAAAKK